MQQVSAQIGADGWEAVAGVSALLVRRGPDVLAVLPAVLDEMVRAAGLRSAVLRRAGDHPGTGELLAVAGEVVVPVAPVPAQRAAACELRVVGPGDVVTMDYREDRLNLRVDYRRRITSVRCG